VSVAEPDFVSAYDIGDFVYFFFRETAVEYINCGKVLRTCTYLISQFTPVHLHRVKPAAGIFIVNLLVVKLILIVTP